MRYFVLAEDGNRYGPADARLLNQWIDEGRLLPEMLLEEDGSKHKVTAASVAGLDFYGEAADLTAAPQPQKLLSDEPIESVHESIQADLWLAFGMVVATLIFSAFRPAYGFLGLPTTLLGLIASMKAKERGNELASVALVVNMLALAVWIASRVIYGLG